MVNYDDTIIYKLCCKNPEITDIYVGHTCNHTRRKHEHKKACNNSNRKDYNYHVYKFIRDNGGWYNWNIVMIEEYPCESKLQAEKRERYWIETLNSTLNCSIPSRSKKEYYDDNKNDILEKHKKYREENTEEIKEKNKKYREENKQKIKERKKKYCEENIEKIKEYRSKKIKCECGYEISRNNISTHKKTNKHLEAMKLKETET